MKKKKIVRYEMYVKTPNLTTNGAVPLTQTLFNRNLKKFLKSAEKKKQNFDFFTDSSESEEYIKKSYIFRDNGTTICLVEEKAKEGYCFVKGTSNRARVQKLNA